MSLPSRNCLFKTSSLGSLVTGPAWTLEFLLLLLLSNIFPFVLPPVKLHLLQVHPGWVWEYRAERLARGQGCWREWGRAEGVEGGLRGGWGGAPLPVLLHSTSLGYILHTRPWHRVKVNLIQSSLNCKWIHIRRKAEWYIDFSVLILTLHILIHLRSETYDTSCGSRWYSLANVLPCAAVMAWHVLPCVAMCCHVLKCVAMCCCLGMCCHVLPCADMCCHVQTCAAVMAWHGIGQQCIVALRAINLIDVAQIAQMMWKIWCHQQVHRYKSVHVFISLFENYANNKDIDTNDILHKYSLQGHWNICKAVVM